MERRILSLDDLEKVETLQTAILSHLKARGQEHFIIPRTTTYFCAHLQIPHAMTGIFAEKQLVAQAIFHRQTDEAHDYTRLNTLPGQQQDDQVAIIKGVLVHPDHQGRGLMKQLITDFENWAGENKITHLLSRMEITHNASRAAFEKHGFTVINTITDARDDADVFVVHKRRRGQ